MSSSDAETDIKLNIIIIIYYIVTQLTESDQELYANFPLVVSERWQQEIAETVFDAVNQETDKLELKRRPKTRIDDSDDNCER